MPRTADADGPDLTVAPTEPPQLKAVATTISQMPERLGCDVAWWGSNDGEDCLWGVQRKELKDLIASVQDGRIAREIAQMNASIPMPLIVIEGKIQFDTNGNLMWNSWGRDFTRAQWYGMLWGMMNEGARVLFTKDINETVQFVQMYAQWTTKQRHGSLMRRPGPFNAWGKTTNEDFAIHLLEGFDGLGREKAKSIIKHFEGVPLQWTVTEKQLVEVPGVGKVIAKKLMEALGG